MQEQFQKKKNKYDNEVKEAWKECDQYIEKHYVKPENEEILLNKGRYSIPRTKPITQYVFYNYTNKNVIGKDDPKLRYIPFIEGAKDITGIDLYDELSFKEPVISEDLTIKSYVLEDIFDFYKDIDMFELNEKIKNKGIDMDLLVNFPLIDDFIKFTGITLIDVMKNWEEWFDDHCKQLYSNPNTFYNYFCSVCFLFDCGIHDVIDFSEAK